MPKKTVIEKATGDKPVWFPLDRDQRAILVIYHFSSSWIIKTRGWTLNEVLAIMGWEFDDVWASFKRPWRKDRGAVSMTPVGKDQKGLDKLNEKGGSE